MYRCKSEIIKRLHIMGCARSGNTLMLHLLGSGFNNTVIFHGESYISTKGKYKNLSDKRGGWKKRTADEEFAINRFREFENSGNILITKAPRMTKKLKKIMCDEQGLIFMIRDPRDTLTSYRSADHDKFYNKISRWLYNAKIASELQNNKKVLIVKFENLVLNPEKIQKEIAEKFRLEILRPFPDCYTHFENDEYSAETSNGFRPLDESRIANWKNDRKKRKRVEEILNGSKANIINMYMKEFGYE